MLLPCWIAETFSGSGSNVTLVWPSMVVCVELLPARLICVSSPNAANLLTTSFRSPRYCAHISGIGKLIAAGNPLPVFSRISKIQAPWCNYQKQWENILFLQSRALFFFFFSQWLTVMSFTLWRTTFLYDWLTFKFSCRKKSHSCKISNHLTDSLFSSAHAKHRRELMGLELL